MYITYEEYNYLYLHDNIEGQMFISLSREACRIMDVHTTGIDNVKKLRRFFPTDKEDAWVVKQCAAKLINTLNQIRQAEESAIMARGYTQTDQGLRRQIISRVESGNEAISYSETKNANTEIDAAVEDRTARTKLLAEIVWEYLRGIEDSNGVNLLYMGMYPRRYLC